MFVAGEVGWSPMASRATNDYFGVSFITVPWTRSVQYTLVPSTTIEPEKPWSDAMRVGAVPSSAAFITAPVRRL